MTVKQIFQSFIILALLIFFVWLAFYFLIFALILGACVTVFLIARRFLIDKGIINPPAAYTSPTHPDDTPDVEIIEVEYQEVQTPENKDSQ